MTTKTKLIKDDNYYTKLALEFENNLPEAASEITVFPERIQKREDERNHK